MSMIQEVDVGLSNFDTTWERSQLLESVWPAVYSRIDMVYRTPDKHVYAMPLGPLSCFVVYAALGTFAFTSLVVWALETTPLYFRREAGNLPPPTFLVIMEKFDKVLQILGAAILAERELNASYLCFGHRHSHTYGLMLAGVIFV